MTSPMTRPESRDPAGRHPANAVSLVFGLVFVGLALEWLLLQVGMLGLSDLRWSLPVLFIGAGLAGVLVSLFRR